MFTAFRATNAAVFAILSSLTVGSLSAQELSAPGRISPQLQQKVATTYIVEYDESVNPSTYRRNAASIASRSYAPYSGIETACVVLLSDGTWVPGVRVENASFPLLIPAAMNAITTSVAAGRLDVVAAVSNRVLGGRDMATTERAGEEANQSAMSTKCEPESARTCRSACQSCGPVRPASRRVCPHGIRGRVGARATAGPS